MTAPKPRIKIPKKVKIGSVFAVKTLIRHRMESGQRKNKKGEKIPRSIINAFVCRFNGEIVFACDIEPAVSANPYFQFNARIAEPGTFAFSWFDDDGAVYEAERNVEIA